MKRYNQISVLILGLFYSIVSIAQNQYFESPKALVVGDIPSNNYQIIYPLGWSEDGIFAYVHQDINTLSGTQDYHYNVIFQNMKSNKVIWNKVIDYPLKMDDKFPTDKTPYNYAFFKLIIWFENYKEIGNQLNQFKIKTEDSSLKNVGDLPKDISLKESEEKELDITNQYRITLYRKGKSKQVYRLDCKQDKKKCEANESIWYRTFAVKGFFKSPFENQIAILVFKETNGFEEPFEYPFFIGTNLEEGFMDLGCK